MKSKSITYLLLFASVTIPLLMYICLSLYLKTWIIDDAGISFAYSRSLANGDGLVAQHGAERVEGYSNFLWVLILTPFFLIHQFDPILTPKIVAACLVAILFLVNTKICMLLKYSPFIGILINLGIAMNAPFVIWTTSGLENSLYVLLISILLWLSIRYTVIPNNKHILYCALIAFCISITRPDGIVFSLLLGVAIISSRQLIRFKIKHLIYYTLVFVGLMGGFLLFRWLYFHDWFPNTYYAKKTSIGDEIKGFFIFKKAFTKKYHSLFLSMGGIDFISVFYAFCGLLVIQKVIWRKKFKLNWVLFSAWFLSFLVYILMPYDWMGHYRFATPFVIMTFISLSLIGARLILLLPKFKTVGTALLLFFWIIFSWISFNDHQKRIKKFSQLPTVPLYAIKTAYADKFNYYAKVLHIKNGSILLPDVGAMYYYSNLRVFDSAGLCDKTIAKGKFTRNRSMIIDYVFNTVKPTFIHLHDGWSEMIRVDDYPNFRKEYRPIYETLAVPETDYYGVNIYSGDYVRKDVINSQNEPLLQNIISNRNNIFD